MLFFSVFIGESFFFILFSLHGIQSVLRLFELGMHSNAKTPLSHFVHAWILYARVNHQSTSNIFIKSGITSRVSKWELFFFNTNVHEKIYTLLHLMFWFITELLKHINIIYIFKKIYLTDLQNLWNDTMYMYQDTHICITELPGWYPILEKAGIEYRFGWRIILYK